MRGGNSGLVNLSLFFHVSNLIGVTFSNSSGQPITVTDTDNRPADITYFTFRSHVSTNTVDCRAPKKSLALEFSLRLPQTLRQSALPSTTTPVSVSTPLFVPDSTQPVQDLAFTLVSAKIGRAGRALTRYTCH